MDSQLKRESWLKRSKTNFQILNDIDVYLIYFLFVFSVFFQVYSIDLRTVNTNKFKI